MLGAILQITLSQGVCARGVQMFRIGQKCIKLCLWQVVTVLKKDVIKSQSKDLDKGDEYRQILVQAIHSCAIKFPAVAANVVLLLMGLPLSSSELVNCIAHISSLILVFFFFFFIMEFLHNRDTLSTLMQALHPVNFPRARHIYAMPSPMGFSGKKLGVRGGFKLWQVEVLYLYFIAQCPFEQWLS